jgi:hypothetical protein
MELTKVLKHRIQTLNQNILSKKKWSTLFSWLRFSAFALLIYFIYLTLYEKDASHLLFVFPILFIFVILIITHNRLTQKINMLAAKIQINKEELMRLDHQFDKNREGTEFVNPDHDYSFDLDLFGEGSLFQQIDRTEIPSASQDLAHLLENPLEERQALDQQISIQALTDQLEWCQDWQASLKTQKPEKKEDFYLTFPKSISNWFILLSIILTITTIVLVAGSVVLGYTFSFVLGILPVNLFVLFATHKQLADSDGQLAKLSRILNQYLIAFRLTQKLDPKNSHQLTELVTELSQSSIKAWKELSQIIYLVNSRENLMYWLINPFLFIDIWSYVALYRWGTKYESQLAKWIHQANTLDVLVSLAGYARLHTSNNYPTLTSADKCFEGIAIGHPMIPSEQRVTNDFKLSTDHPVSILTGSNMAGKSTFLRTIGILHVMSWIGLPVPADRLTIGRFTVFTSMRTTDDINQSTSSFYAELKRIKKLLDSISNSSRTVLYFLDEILKGTNSHDRHSGAVGLIKQLTTKNGLGFISTHDLSLANQYDGHAHIKNYSFNSKLHNGQLLFDYTLTAEICHSTNASELMRQMGIIQSDDTE